MISLSPLAVLARGYAVIFDDKGEVVRDATDVESGEVLRSRVANGTITSTVTTTEL
jgi:exodeoxyribonuclease VII large subunit